VKRTWLWLVVGLALGAGLAAAQPADEEAPSVWTDPEFKKRFLGTYGIHSDVEPKIGPQERAVLEKVSGLLATDPAAAALALEAAATPEATALFDFVLGNLAFEDDRTADAEARYLVAVTKLPSFRRAWKNLGLVQMREGRQAEAIGSLTKAVELGGGDSLTYGLLGQAYAATGDHLAAESAYRNALLLDPANTELRLGLARSVIRQEKYEEAVALLRVLIEKDQERADLWLLQANAYLGLKQPARAAENLEIVARMGAAKPETMNLLGDIYVNEGRPDLAARAYVRAIDLDPAQPAARSLAAVEALAARGNTLEAEAVAARAREVFQERMTDAEVQRLLKLQARLDLAAGKTDDAAQVLGEVIARDPFDGDALMLLGQHYARAGDPEQAAIYYDQAASLDAFEARAKLGLAQIRVGQGKYQEALPLLKRAQELKPSDELARFVDQVERLARSQR